MADDPRMSADDAADTFFASLRDTLGHMIAVLEQMKVVNEEIDRRLTALEQRFAQLGSNLLSERH